MKKSIAKIQNNQNVLILSKSQQLKTKGLGDGVDKVDTIIIPDVVDVD